MFNGRVLSSVSEEEIVKLTASFHYWSNPKQYNCLEKHESLSGQRLEDFKNRNGCGFRFSKEPRREENGYYFYSCFCDHLDPNFGYLMTLHQNYEQFGTLPYSGSLSEQPAKIIEVFQILSDLKLKRREELEKQK